MSKDFTCFSLVTQPKTSFYQSPEHYNSLWGFWELYDAYLSPDFTVISSCFLHHYVIFIFHLRFR